MGIVSLAELVNGLKEKNVYIPLYQRNYKWTDSKEKKNAVDIIYAAVGYELLENDIHEAEQLAKDYIDSEKLELREMMEEYHGDE